MKYLDVVRGLKLAEELFNSKDINTDGSDVRLVTFQDGANGKIRERIEMKRSIVGGEITVSFTPNEEQICPILPNE